MPHHLSLYPLLLFDVLLDLIELHLDWFLKAHVARVLHGLLHSIRDVRHHELPLHLILLSCALVILKLPHFLNLN